MKVKNIILSALLVGMGLVTMPKVNVSAIESKQIISTIDAKALNPNTQYEGSFQLHDEMIDYYSSKTYGETSTVGLYFSVPRSLDYYIYDTINDSPFGARWSGLQKQMYHVDKETNALTLVGETPYDIKVASTNQPYTCEPLKVHLKAGEKYLLVYNNDAHKIPLPKFNIRTMFVQELPIPPVE